MGEIIRTTARGGWMGNRGLLHNDQQHIVRPYRLTAWITCVLSFKGRRRKVMSPGLYTELFFLDEATAFSAGHRPCKECRREDHMRFKQCWMAGNPAYGFNEKTKIGEIDAVIHKERITAHLTKVTYQEEISQLPDGSFVMVDNQPFLVKGDGLFLWTPAGYSTKLARPKNQTVTVLTPRSIVNTFKAGYDPQLLLPDS